MRFKTGTTDVPSAGTRVQLSNTAEQVLTIQVYARAGNSGLVYFGISDVSASNGREIAAGEDITIDFRGLTKQSDGSIQFNKFYVDAATNGDDVDWMVIIR